MVKKPSFDLANMFIKITFLFKSESFMNQEISDLLTNSFCLELKFDDHLKIVLGKMSKTIEFLANCKVLSPRAALTTIYKAFITAYLDHSDILYDKVYNMSLTKSWNPFSIMLAWL